MTPLTVGIIGMVIMFILLFSRMPIGFVMGLVGFTGFAYLGGWQAAWGILGQVPYRTFADYGLSVIPLFILMGSFCFYSGMSKNLYKTAHDILGSLRGGLAMSTVVACAAFAAVSGSSVATAATMGTVALPEMKRYKYNDRLATGSIAAGGTMGILIPPSVIFIIYGILTEQSIGKLFAAGLFPGILEAVFYMITIYILCKRNPLMGPSGPQNSILHKVTALKGSWEVLLLFVLVIGGIYIGVFSPTEAAGVGAFIALISGLIRRNIGWKGIKDSLVETGTTTAMMFTIVLGAMILGYFLAVSRLPYEFSTIIGSLPVNRYIILITIIIFYVFLGCVMDALAMILLTVPIFYPLILSLGFDPLWFGVVIVRMVEIGMITPPVGMNVYVIKGVAKDVPMEEIFKGIIPFLIADFLHVTLLILVPQISTWLPSKIML